MKRLLEQAPNPYFQRAAYRGPLKSNVEPHPT
jgi:hypothetical protein